MSGVKLLNLDDLVVVDRVVTIGGVDYPVAEQTIGQMITRLALAKKSEANQDDPMTILSALRDTARQILPSAPKEIIDGLQSKQIVKLIEFVNQGDEDVVAKAEERGIEEIAEIEKDGKK